MPNAKFIPAADWTAAPEVFVTDGTKLVGALPPGVYYPMLSATSSITVPELTAGTIFQVAPTEGDVLTIAPGNYGHMAVFQWQKDGVNILGETQASIDTAPHGVGVYRRAVTEGVQGPVYTPEVTVAADVTAPVLANPINAADGETASTGRVATDEAKGMLYWVVTTSATAPTAAQIKLGQDNAGVAATASGSQVVTTAGQQPLSPAPSGLAPGTTYTTHFMHEDTVGNQSAVASAPAFTTAAALADPEAGLTLSGEHGSGVELWDADVSKTPPVVMACDFTGLATGVDGVIFESGAGVLGACLSVEGTDLVLRAGNGAAKWPSSCAYIVTPCPTGDGTLVWEINAGGLRLWWNGTQIGTQQGSFTGDYAGADNGAFFFIHSGIVEGAPAAGFTGYATRSDVRVYNGQTSSL
jgi:hypothetical protein